MREIKFRAWDKANRCMIGDDDSEADFKFYGGGVTVRYCSEEFYEGGGEIHSRDRWEDCDVEIMQYTGLKDKNGKEIYEGDILRDVFESGNSQVVIYDEDRFMVRGAGVRLSSYAAKPQIEVIGNVYENPELLTSEPEVQECDATKKDQGTEADKIK